MKRIFAAAAFAVALSPLGAWATDPVARAQYPARDTSGQVQGSLPMGLDASSFAVPCGSSTVVTGCGIGSNVGPAATTPTAGTASAIVTGGTAVTLITGPVNGCYIVNPLSAADQNIATAEIAYINPVGAATVTGRGTTATLQPGQNFTCPPGMTTNVSVNAATSAHAFTVVKW